MSIVSVIHWFGGLAAWGALALLMFGIWQGTRRTPGHTSGRAAGWLRSPLFYALALIAFLAISIAGWQPLPLDLPPSYDWLALLLGSLFYFPGIGLVIWGRLALGSMYFVSTSLGAQLFQDHQLLKTGPYAMVRHPMYLGLVLVALGSLLIYWNWTCLLFLIFSPFVLLRARREELALAEAFGREWQEYCRAVPAFLPRFIRITGASLRQ
jgi:protein-S-isoprenylcysteine O-methyltransferase Ste14